MDDLLAGEFGVPGLEFAWSPGAPVDPAAQEQVLSAYTGRGILTINEARAMLGRDPLPDPAADRAMALTGAGYVPLGQTAPAVAKLGKDAGWDEGQHPRWPAGAGEGQGGRFAPGGGAGGSSAQDAGAVVGPGAVVPIAERVADDADGGACTVDLPPPGDCKEEQFRDLQQRVENACGAAAKCVAGESPEVLQYKIAGHYACIRARQRINDTCFRGGNPTHNQSIAERYNAIKNCYNLGGGIPRWIRRKSSFLQTSRERLPIGQCRPDA